MIALPTQPNCPTEPRSGKGGRVLPRRNSAARQSASGSNLQPLKYIISCDPDKNAIIFPHLAWAGYLKDWDIRYWRDGVHHVPKRPLSEIIIEGGLGKPRHSWFQSLLLPRTELS